MKKELKNILVPIDFNEPSLKAAEFAANLAKRIDGDIFLLNVIETPGLLADFLASGNHLVRLVDQAKEKLQDITHRIGAINGSVNVNHRVERGKSYVRILEVAEEINARFIILGYNHEEDDAEQELGSTVYHVTLKSSVPVLTLKGNATEMGKRIVVPLDLTKETRKQLFSAVVYGMNYGASIHLVSALSAGMNMEESMIYKKLKRAKRVLDENGVESTMKLFDHSKVPPFNRVIDYADEIDADMILLMTHQEGYRYDNYIGAFAHHIISESTVSVLSLTSSASGSGSNNLMKAVIDPVGWFK
jgi:nucleotide-binding universal stress UspA family protein